MNILIVEDCKVMQLMIERILKMSGFGCENVFQAENGKVGLEMLKANPIDLAIVDMNMPVMDGMEMLKTVRSHPDWKELSVLVVSTESNEKRIESVMNLSNHFVHKPFTPEFLKKEILKITHELKS